MIKKSKESFTKKWIVSILELEDNEGRLYKVNKRIPEFSVAETKMFRNKKEAIKQFKEWLKY